MLRKGTLPNVQHAFSKIVHVGHSFGSALSYTMAAMHPTASDGLILTGFSQNGSFIPSTAAAWDSKLARLNQPLRFGNISYSAVAGALSTLSISSSNLTAIADAVSKYDITLAEIQQIFQTTDLGDLLAGAEPTQLPHMADLPSGYLTWTDVGSNQYAFLLPGFFDPSILQFAEASKFPYTIGELLTLGSAKYAATGFKGPVQVLTGREFPSPLNLPPSLPFPPPPKIINHIPLTRSLRRTRRHILRRRLPRNRGPSARLHPRESQSGIPGRQDVRSVYPAEHGAWDQYAL